MTIDSAWFYKMWLAGGIMPGHPLILGPTGDMVFFRSARVSPHSGTFMICVADGAGGFIAVDPEELSPIQDDF